MFLRHIIDFKSCYLFEAKREGGRESVVCMPPPASPCHKCLPTARVDQAEAQSKESGMQFRSPTWMAGAVTLAGSWSRDRTQTRAFQCGMQVSQVASGPLVRSPPQDFAICLVLHAHSHPFIFSFN